MKATFIALLGVLSFLSVSAQNDTLYYQYENVPVSKTDSFLSYKVVSSKNGDRKYNVEEYDKENKIQSKGIYSVISDKGLDTLDGWFTGYDSLNNINREGLYINGNKEGKWKQYYSGTNQLWYTDTYKKGLRDGSLKSYYRSGKVKRLEEFEKGTSVYGQKFDEDGNEIEFTTFSKPLQFPVNMSQFLAENLRYPMHEKENNIQGRVWVEYVIDEQGYMESVRLLSAPSKGLAMEALRIFKLLSEKRCEPAIEDDKPLKYYLRQPIYFKLN